MPVSAEFADFIVEQMLALGLVSRRRMFGGMGLFHDGLMFALIDNDVLYLKADNEARGAFEAEGLKPFSYATKRGEYTLASYWRAPERCLDDADEMAAWAGRAIDVAKRAKRPTR